MKKIAVFLFSICLAGLFSSCSKKDDIPVNETGLAGTWRWTDTEGGLSYTHETPASTGKEINLVLSNDNRYAFYTNGTLTSSGTFTLQNRQCIHDVTAKQFIDFSNPSDVDMTIETVVTTKLFVSDDYADGYMTTYSRL